MRTRSRQLRRHGAGGNLFGDILLRVYVYVCRIQICSTAGTQNKCKVEIPEPTRRGSERMKNEMTSNDGENAVRSAEMVQKRARVNSRQYVLPPDLVLYVSRTTVSIYHQANGDDAILFTVAVYLKRRWCHKRLTAQ